MAVIISKESAVEILKANRQNWNREEKHNGSATVYDYYTLHGDHKFRVSKLGEDYVFQVI